MTLVEVIEKANDKKLFRRRSWTHADFVKVKGGPTSYGGGEIVWEATGERVTLCYKNDLAANDWHIAGEKP